MVQCSLCPSLEAAARQERRSAKWDRSISSAQTGPCEQAGGVHRQNPHASVARSELMRTGSIASLELLPLRTACTVPQLTGASQLKWELGLGRAAKLRASPERMREGSRKCVPKHVLHPQTRVHGRMRTRKQGSVRCLRR